MNTMRLVGLSILMPALVLFSGLYAHAQPTDTTYEEEMIGEIQNIRKSLDEINASNTTNFLIGIVIAGIAIVATIYNSKKLNRQLEIHEREARHRMRPVLVRGRYDDGNTFRIIDNRMIWIKLTNRGPLPAVGIKRRVRSGVVTGWDGKSDPLDGVPYVDVMLDSMGPDEYVDNIIRLTNKEYVGLVKNKYFFEMHVEYSEPEHDDKTYHYHIRGHFEDGILIQDFVDMS